MRKLCPWLSASKHLTKRADGRTHIAGHRLTPHDMLCQYELGLEAEKLAQEYDLSLAEVYEALALELSLFAIEEEAQAYMMSLSPPA
ncbi:MAG: DUF433 domain-containing protein [Chloroflexota bacterium]